MLEIPLIVRAVEVKIGNDVFSLPVRTMNTEVALELSELQNNNLKFKKISENIEKDSQKLRNDLVEKKSKFEVLKYSNTIEKENLEKEINEIENKISSLEIVFNDNQKDVQINYMNMIKACFEDYSSIKHVVNQIPFSMFQEFFESVISEMSRMENSDVPKKKLAKK